MVHESRRYLTSTGENPSNSREICKERKAGQKKTLAENGSGG